MYIPWIIYEVGWSSKSSWHIHTSAVSASLEINEGFKFQWGDTVIPFDIWHFKMQMPYVVRWETYINKGDFNSRVTKWQSIWLNTL